VSARAGALSLSIHLPQKKNESAETRAQKQNKPFVEGKNTAKNQRRRGRAPPGSRPFSSPLLFSTNLTHTIARFLNKTKSTEARVSLKPLSARRASAVWQQQQRRLSAAIAASAAPLRPLFSFSLGLAPLEARRLCRRL
jgi:hypothetical protein